MLFEWLQPAFAQIWGQRERLPHALLLYGPEGVGIHELAVAAGKALLCDKPQADGLPCGACTHCRLIAAGTHPDWFDIGLELNDSGKLSSEIKIGQIRELCQSLSRTRQMGRYKITILSPAEKMNRNAANSLLKTLEEPVAETILLLVSSQPARLPATVRSRSQQLRVQAPPAATVKQWLQQHYAALDANALYAASGGAPVSARDIAEQSLLPVRSGLFVDMQALITTGGDPLAVAENWKDANLHWVFSWLVGWLEDLILIKHGGSDSILNTDLEKPLHLLSGRVNLHKMIRLLERVLRAKQLLDSSVNHRLLYESLLLEWVDIRQS